MFFSYTVFCRFVVQDLIDMDAIDNRVIEPGNRAFGDQPACITQFDHMPVDRLSVHAHVAGKRLHRGEDIASIRVRIDGHRV